MRQLANARLDSGCKASGAATSDLVTNDSTQVILVTFLSTRFQSFHDEMLHAHRHNIERTALAELSRRVQEDELQLNTFREEVQLKQQVPHRSSPSRRPLKSPSPEPSCAPFRLTLSLPLKSQLNRGSVDVKLDSKNPFKVLF